MGVKDYLMLGRAHSAAAEMFGLPIAAYLAGVRGWFLLVFFLLGWIVHSAGFSMNSLLDYLNDYDTKDPSKADHPLVAGRMSVVNAALYTFGLQLLGLGIFMFIARTWYSIVFFAVYVITGWLYNINTKKHKILGTYELATSMGMLFIATASIYSFSVLYVIIGIYIASVTMFQVAVAGEVKDFHTKSDEINLMKFLGSSEKDNKISRKFKVITYFIAVLKSVSLTSLIFITYHETLVSAILIPISWYIFLIYAKSMTTPMGHKTSLEIIGLGEVFSYLLFVIAIMPLLMEIYIAIVVFLILPVVYYMVINGFVWDSSLLVPKV